MIEPLLNGRWPTYRPRRAVRARRLNEPMSVEGHMYRDGYLVRDVHGRVVVMSVADFEAVYELMARDE